MIFYGVDVSDMSIREINKLFREHDDSHKWPINNRFNATNRAIGRAKRFQSETGEHFDNIAYAVFIHDEIGRIVNAAV